MNQDSKSRKDNCAALIQRGLSLNFLVLFMSPLLQHTLSSLQNMSLNTVDECDTMPTYPKR